MFKILRPTRDAYVTDRYINQVSQVTSNVGGAGSLDLYKLYGITSTVSGTIITPNTELSRLLIKFDLDPLRQLVAAGKIDPQNPSFNCVLHLSDVYGGQPTPDNFAVVVNPLSRSFDEGRGRDVVMYSDYDTCNWLTASLAGGTWYVTGCSLGGNDVVPSDYMTASHGISLTKTQNFITGEEDLDVDVTTTISATLAGLVPDCGFRISFDPTLESDQHTYFVKRFASRTAYNEDLRPRLLVRYDDSIIDDSGDMYLDAPGTLFLRNYVRSVLTNLSSGSTVVTGSNSLILQLLTQVSGGIRSMYFTGSQHYSGQYPQVGLYSASVIIHDDAMLREQWQASGSITVTPVWGSVDGTVPYLTGSTFKINPPQRGSTVLGSQNQTVTITGIRDTMQPDEATILRINIFDPAGPYVLTSLRLPTAISGEVIRDVHYQVRDAVTNRVEIPFDTINNSTRASSDPLGMYFKLDVSNLTTGRSYTIDVMVVSGDDQRVFESASPSFKVGVAT